MTQAIAGHLQSSVAENRLLPLRLLPHGESGGSPALLIGVFNLDRLAVLGHCHAADADYFPVPLVGLLNRVIPDPLKRNHRVTWVSLDRIVFTVKLRVIAVAVRVGHLQSIGCALVGHDEPIAGDGVYL